MPSVIETRALRKVYPAPPSRRQRSTPGQGVRTGGPPAGGAAHPSPPGGARTLASVVALDALDLRVDEGEFFGLLGPNGAGKTTTIGILTTRVRATSGEAFVAG